MLRRNCAVTWIQFVVDQHGALVIVCFEQRLVLGNAKIAAGVLFRCFLDEFARHVATQSLRPLDEVDADRIRAWQTVASLRPAGKKRAREEEEMVSMVFKQPRTERT